MPESKKKDKNHEKSEKTGVNEVNIPRNIHFIRLITI